MVLTTIAAIVIFYLFLMFLLHEIFKKFFHIIFFIGSVLFFIGVLYLMLKGI